MLILLIIYALLLIAIGALISRRVKSADDFLVARRNLGPGFIFTTLLAANIGAGSTVGAAGLGYEFGLSAWWWVGSAGIGSLILAFTVGPTIWRLAKQSNFYTLGDFLEQRYDRRVRVIVALVLWLGTLALLSGQLIAVSRILDAVANVGKVVGSVIGGIVVVIYFMAGGLLSSAWVNLIQLIVMLGGFLVTVPIALHRAGSWSEVTARVAAQSPDSLRATDYLSLTGAGWSWILGLVILLVPSFIISPGLLQKIYGAKNAHAVRLGVAANAFCLLLFAFLPPLLGVIAFSQFPALSHQEDALPMLMTRMLPEWLGGLALAAVLSAELSTCDAILFMLSTSLSMDLYRTYVNPQANSQTLLWVNRITASVAGALGIVLALALPSVIAALTIFYGLLVVSLCVPLISGLYSTKPDSSSVVAAIVISVIVTLASHRLTHGQGYGWLPPQAVGILVSLVIVVVGAKIRRKSVVRARPE
ncbi:MAG: sodium:solute symporter family protein [Acidobacteria bacterium]|nr:sodium:solute symporter family protein [Acidobacteriota bacterium]